MAMWLKTLVNGPAGSGKSYYLLGHPKVAWLLTEPGSTILLERHPDLAKNVVWWEEFIPSPLEDLKQVFERLEKAILRAHKDFLEGKVETLGFDNLTFLAENRFMYIKQYEPSYGVDKETKKLVLDSRGMYGTLSRWLYAFTLTSLLSFKGHLVATAHEMEQEETNEYGKQVKTGNVVPSILGGFREKVEGLVSASFYLRVKREAATKPGEATRYRYWARCLQGEGRLAKNRYGLREWIEDVSYQKVMESINQKKANGGTPA